MDPEWVLHDGHPFTDALVLSHPEQRDRLRDSCPQAVDSAVLAGDPCFDRILGHRDLRVPYRRALGVRTGQRLVLLNSTWAKGSLAGGPLPSLLPRLTAELPADEYRIAAVLHPNIWSAHGPGQIRAWFDRALNAGVTLVDPLHDWRQALIAADAVIGDHGSVSFYAAALGTPVLLGAAPLTDIDHRSPSAAFVREAPLLDMNAPLRPQLDSLTTPPAGPARFTTSMPGASAARLRRLFYGLLGLPEPVHTATLRRLPLPAHAPAERTAPQRVLTSVTAPGEVSITRYVDPPFEPEGEGEALTVVHERTRERHALALADVVFHEGPPHDVRLGRPDQWTAEALARHPHAGLTLYVDSPDTATARTRGGLVLRLTAGPQADADPVAYGCALHAWTASGKSLDDLVAHGLRVRLGGVSHLVDVALVMH
ncbi:hypothetical protein [Streptomyces sp. N35]|uniref:hypothetical protein n=1 Tax=Streptomyces sp. N35 TaxID=2795730 RepID=UPI0018F7ACCA|nr:hypothetical protein [Streptomyces sp. N35]